MDRPRLVLNVLLVVAVAFATVAPSASVAIGDGADRIGDGADRSPLEDRSPVEKSGTAPASGSASDTGADPVAGSDDGDGDFAGPDDGPGSEQRGGTDRSPEDGRSPAESVDVPARDPPGRLGLDSEDVRSTYVTPEASLMGIVSSGDGELESGYGIAWYEHRLERADNDSHRRAILEETLAFAERRLAVLRAREAAAIRSYHNETASERDLVVALARIDAQAGTLRRGLDEIERYADDPIRIGNIQRGLSSLQGPVRDSVRAGIEGEERAPIHVTATRNGLVLETVLDGEYVRSAVRLDHASSDDSGVSTPTTELMERLYPSAFPRPESLRIDGTSESHLLNVGFRYSGVSVDLYLNVERELVYRERQTLSLDRLATTRVANETDNGVNVAVNRTVMGNPTLVNVTEGGEPVDAVVRIDGQRVGRTGDDGRLWTVGPPGAHEVTVLTFRETVNVTVPARSAAVEPAVYPSTDRPRSSGGLDGPGVYLRRGAHPVA